MVVTAAGSARTRGTGEPRLQLLVDAVPLPAAVLDDRGRIQALNQAWRDQARPGAMVDTVDGPGQDHLHMLRDEKGFHRQAGKMLAETIDTVMQGERPQAECRYDLGQGSPRPWLATATRIQLDDEHYTMLVHQDLGTRDRMGEMARRVGELLVDHEESVAIAHDRRRLLATAEQQFHAPLTPIRLQLHLLRSGALGELDARQMNALETIERNVRRWWGLQEDLMSSLDSLDRGGYSPQQIDARDILDEAMQPFHERALKAGVRLRVDRSDQPMPVIADARGSVQVIMLVLDHAVRETPAGGLVWVRLRPAGDHIELSIQDQDPQMDPEAAEALLDPDAPSENSLRSSLLHAQTVLRRQQGTIEARCTGAGQGLDILLRLPCMGSTGTEGRSAPEATSQHA